MIYWCQRFSVFFTGAALYDRACHELDDNETKPRSLKDIFFGSKSGMNEVKSSTQGICLYRSVQLYDSVFNQFKCSLLFHVRMHLFYVLWLNDT